MKREDWRGLDPRLWPLAEHGRYPRRFVLWRDVDRSGVSGTGAVATGVQWPTGHCVMEWTGPPYGHNWYPSMHDVVMLQGHGGDSTVIWIDEE